jgi:hypothetical protein
MDYKHTTLNYVSIPIPTTPTDTAHKQNPLDSKPPKKPSQPSQTPNLSQVSKKNLRKAAEKAYQLRSSLGPKPKNSHPNSELPSKQSDEEIQLLDKRDYDQLGQKFSSRQVTSNKIMKLSSVSGVIELGSVDFEEKAFVRSRSEKFYGKKIAPLVSKGKAKPGVGHLTLDLESVLGKRVGLSSSCAREGVTQPQTENIRAGQSVNQKRAKGKRTNFPQVTFNDQFGRAITTTNIVNLSIQNFHKNYNYFQGPASTRHCAPKNSAKFTKPSHEKPSMVSTTSGPKIVNYVITECGSQADSDTSQSQENSDVRIGLKLKLPIVIHPNTKPDATQVTSTEGAKAPKNTPEKIVVNRKNRFPQVYMPDLTVTSQSSVNRNPGLTQSFVMGKEIWFKKDAGLDDDDCLIEECGNRQSDIYRPFTRRELAVFDELWYNRIHDTRIRIGKSFQANIPNIKGAISCERKNNGTRVEIDKLIDRIGFER